MLGTPYGFLSVTKYVANAVDLDGISDFINRGADLDMSDGTDFTISAWFNRQGGDGANRHIFSGTDINLRLQLNTANKIFFSCGAPGGGAIWQGQTTATFTATGWHHVLVSISMVATPKRHIFIDDVVDQNDVFGPGSGGTVDLTHADWDVGQRSDNTFKWDGFLSEVWFTDTFIDITVAANRRKFITAGLKPVNLGLDGSRPLSAVPSAYFRKASPDWEQNQGSGGGFTENGTLDAAASSPSD